MGQASEADELSAWLRLALSPGLSRAAARRLLAGLGSPQAVLAAGPAAWRHYLNDKQIQALAAPEADWPQRRDAALTWLQATEHSTPRQLLTLADLDYPRGLLETADPPLLLFVQGRRKLLAADMLAVVGSRNPSPQGSDNAEAFGEALSASGLCVVSGLALGIDAAAHRGALKAAGSTIAVLGTGIDSIYPRRNAALGAAIAERGLLISEYAPGAPALPSNFPVRNRIIAGLGRGCLVVEAALQSGSLITARLAAEAGREVMAIPGSIHSPLSHGCHALLREGATLVETVQDVLDAIGRPAPVASKPVAKARAEPAPIGTADPINSLLDCMGHDPVSLDALIARGGWQVAQLNALLLELELQQRVARLPGGLFQRRGQG
ncbi:DNA-processing protein DprA [Paucibacter sp. APW11]|uniref:DNA-processing protein DprA n=1 Tax=Roseateles aquae TaxID=3077235 RepID=A0ABU3PBC2_9BURK|nr:DNA-processing protein DprA [Paucibacter sp. APW11]MDT8999823.1 DNA-processing protein DprA [Paucibacter sp. APW11]